MIDWKDCSSIKLIFFFDRFLFPLIIGIPKTIVLWNQNGEKVSLTINEDALTELFLSQDPIMLTSLTLLVNITRIKENLDHVSTNIKWSIVSLLIKFSSSNFSLVMLLFSFQTSRAIQQIQSQEKSIGRGDLSCSVDVYSGLTEEKSLSNPTFNNKHLIERWRKRIFSSTDTVGYISLYCEWMPIFACLFCSPASTSTP